MSSAGFTLSPALCDEGDLDEDAADVYERELTRLFMESPEGRALEAEGVELGSVASLDRTGVLGHRHTDGGSVERAGGPTVAAIKMTSNESQRMVELGQAP